MNDFIGKRKKVLDAFKKDYRGKLNQSSQVEIPKDMFVKCEGCNELLLKDDLVRFFYVCPKCHYHFRIQARQRLEMLDSEKTFKEMDEDILPSNPLNYPGYLEKINKYQEQTKEKEAFISGVISLEGQKIALGIMDSNFLMGSMGCVVGEKVTRLFEYATANRLAVVIFASSGGARMQEGLFSLLQMAKTSAALKRHDEAGLLYISFLTDPTTGGVAASFATLGDIILAEKGALIGFAGPRVIRQTIREELPQGFQTAEFLLQKGFIDKVLLREEIRPTLIKILKMHGEQYA